jgi:hypothetical protein
VFLSEDTSNQSARPQPSALSGTITFHFVRQCPIQGGSVRAGLASGNNFGNAIHLHTANPVGPRSAVRTWTFPRSVLPGPDRP